MSDGRGVRTLIEEASALAIVGRTVEAGTVLDDLVAQLAAVERHGDTRSTLELARARIGLDGGIGDVRRMLESVLERGDRHAWRAALELARVEYRAGRSERAASLLQDALARFRALDGLDPAASEGLAGLITTEVERVTGTRTIAGDERGSLDAQRLLSLVEFGRRLAAETDPGEVLRIVLHEALGLSGAERGFVVIVDDGRLEFSVAEHMDCSAIDRPAAEVSRSLIDEVRRTRRVELSSVSDLPDDHPAGRSLRAIGSHAVVCVPIPGADEVFGALYLDGASLATEGRAGRLRLLELCGNLAGAALSSAVDHRETSRALEAAEESLRRQRREQQQRTSYEGIVGGSPPMLQLYRQLDRIATTEDTVIITGETGTGKDLVARLIHSRGPRSDGEFTAVNCAALSETLLESELFGYERGAFTGADRSRPGLFELSNRGTLFLGEGGDVRPRMQADVLRVLRSGEVRRIGGRQTVRFDVRVIAATHRDLEERIGKGEFRQDLYYRLHVLPVRIPPLRERVEDLPLLVEHLLERLATGREPLRFTDEAMARLAAYHWPGNVRELENVLRRLLAASSRIIRPRELPTEILGTPETPAAGTLREAESRAIRRALVAAGGNKSKTARILGITRATLYAKLKSGAC